MSQAISIEAEDYRALKEIAARTELEPVPLRKKHTLDPDLGLAKAALHYAIQRTLDELRGAQ